MIRKALKKRLGTTSKYGWALARETTASLLTYELYPIGMVGESLPVVPGLWTKKQPGKEEHPPILFIHGVFHNRATFAWLLQKLGAAGFHRFRQLNLSTSMHSIPKLAQQTAFHVQQLLDRYSVPQIDIVAHSMGGIIARYFIQKLGGNGIVRHLITLGTPHQGTRWSQLLVLPHLRELSPLSRTITELNRLPPPTMTQGLAISGDLDIFTNGNDSWFWPGIRNIKLQGVGHAGLLFSKRVARLVVSRLEEPLEISEPLLLPALAK